MLIRVGYFEVRKRVGKRCKLFFEMIFGSISARKLDFCATCIMFACKTLSLNLADLLSSSMTL